MAKVGHMAGKTGQSPAALDVGLDRGMWQCAESGDVTEVAHGEVDEDAVLIGGAVVGRTLVHGFLLVVGPVIRAIPVQ
jgi:hypothetical protein